MKKKKALLVLMMAAIMVAVGGMATLVLQYFADTAGSRNTGGDLSLDYLVTDEEDDEDEATAQTSQNIFQWLMDKLAADKADAEDDLIEDANSGGQTSSGVSQNHKGDGDDNQEEKEPDESVEITENEETKPDQEEQKQDKDSKDEQEVQPEDTTTPKDEPQDTKKGDVVTLTIRCDTAVAKGMNTEAKWAGIVPSSGVILPVTEIEIDPGETVFSVLCRASNQYKFQMEYSGTNGAEYIEGINNLYEFDGGRWSGWMYCVNDWYPNYGCGQYALKNGDVIEWNYTCDLGKDLGQEWLGEDWTETHE